MADLISSGLQQWRALAGENTAAEKMVRQRYKRLRRLVDRHFRRQIRAPNYTVFWSNKPEGGHTGIYLKGGCDLEKVWAALPQMHRVVPGIGAIFKEGRASDARSDFILQTLKSWSSEQTREAGARFHLPAQYFQPLLFEKHFSLPGPHGDTDFPKTVVVLSIGPDVVRNAYRHREYGFLVDPGAWWLEQSMSQVLENIEAVTWFRKNFQGVGRIRVEDFFANYCQIIQLLREKTGAKVMVLNTFVLSPGSRLHNYQLDANADEKRRREFNLALMELSEKLDFPIVDIDRVVKQQGVLEAQLDFMHFPPAIHPQIGAEIFRVMQELRVFDG